MSKRETLVLSLMCLIISSGSGFAAGKHIAERNSVRVLSVSCVDPINHTRATKYANP